MGREAKAKAERKARAAELRTRAPHPEKALAYIEQRGRAHAQRLALTLAAQGGPIVR